MYPVQQSPPEGRYGRSADARTDRRLKTLGLVLGAGLLAMVGWFGFSYVSGTDVSGELIKFQVVSEERVEAHLEVRKDADVEGVCTLRAMAEDDAEVARKDVRLDNGRERIDRVISMRTTGPAVNVELVSCATAN
ncbi:DUF4307 domain-containing protein [Streptomyces oceani]|uniref:DUF4307 domain-containing protein n=1 Tax=Streptomyces oceani TaxID=1075402 RepID=A0A1E7KIA7_9ACTN|nr:DUF4307 domain-containing protein [Streptomyces oceani]OEV03679.1 hypothetical protein AN216_10530 [Streptomyces oceani]